MLDVCECPTAASRWQAALAYLRDGREQTPCLVLVAQPRAGRALLRQLAREQRALWGYQVRTWSQLGHQLARQALVTSGDGPLTRGARVALCGQVLEGASETELGPLTRVADQPSLPRALARTLGELQDAGTPPEALQAQAPHLHALQQRYRAQLRGAQLADEHALLQRAIHALQNASVQSASAGFRSLLVLDAPPSSPARATLLATLMRQVPSGLLVQPCGEAHTLALLEAAGCPLRRTTVQPAKKGAGSALQRLQQQLFSNAAIPGPPDPSVQICACLDEAQEAVEIARHLLWAAEEGVAFDRMAVLPRRLAPYRAQLSAALARAGIPAYFAEAGRRPDRSGRALLALLHCAAEGLSARRLAEYFSLEVHGTAAPSAAAPCTGQPAEWLPAERVDHDTPAAQADPTPTAVDLWPRRCEALLQQAAVLRGRERFDRRLRGLREELSEQLARDPSAEQDLKPALDDLDRLQIFAGPLLDQLDALPQEASLEQWLEHLTALALHALRAPHNVLQRLAELRPLSTAAKTADTSTQSPLGLNALLRLLTGHLADLVEHDGSDEGGKVFVADAADARGLEFTMVCVPGLAEKVFPEAVREDPLLLDALRAQLDPGLATHSRRVDEERMHLRLAVGAASERLWLSYPRMDGHRGRPRVPSFYALEVLRAAEGALPSYDHLMRRAEAQTFTRADWPAPVDAHAALDEAEHDLACLGDALLGEVALERLHRPRGSQAPRAPTIAPSPALGSARYLLLSNTFAARTLRARARRWSVRGLGPDDGLVEPGLATRLSLNPLRPTRHAYPAASLSHFAQCPYRFYLHALVGLRAQPTAAPVSELHPLQRAAFLEDCQHALLTHLRDQQLLPLQTRSLLEAQHLAATVVEMQAHAYAERFAPPVERIFRDDVARLLADINTWLRHMAAEANDAQPQHVHLPIRPEPDAEPSSPGSKASANDEAIVLHVKSTAHYVEQSANGIRVTLYRSGRAVAPERMYIAGGRHMQPLLEALWVAARTPKGTAVEGRLYYCTARGGYSERTVPVNDASRAAANTFRDTLERAFEQGSFPALPDKDACNHCTYRVVCGPHEAQRTRQKRGRPLDDLTVLRRIP